MKAIDWRVAQAPAPSSQAWHPFAGERPRTGMRDGNWPGWLKAVVHLGGAALSWLTVVLIVKAMI